MITSKAMDQFLFTSRQMTYKVGPGLATDYISEIFVAIKWWSFLPL